MEVGLGALVVAVLVGAGRLVLRGNRLDLRAELAELRGQVADALEVAGGAVGHAAAVGHKALVRVLGG